jgi:uncharacterized protein (DUF2249 family)
MSPAFVDLDVRPILRSGGEPFQKIMETVAGLAPGQGLRLFATFKPTPLLQVLGSKGFSHDAKDIGGGDWEVLFRPTESMPGPEDKAAVQASDGDNWPDPVQQLDNRELDPPEPMVRILATTETMRKGEVLSALLDREPIFLFPELAKRGHSWRGGFESGDSAYKILVLIGGAKDATA